MQRRWRRKAVMTPCICFHNNGAQNNGRVIFVVLKRHTWKTYLYFEVRKFFSVLCFCGQWPQRLLSLKFKSLVSLSLMRTCETKTDVKYQSKLRSILVSLFGLRIKLIVQRALVCIVWKVSLIEYMFKFFDKTLFWEGVNKNYESC